MRRSLPIVLALVALMQFTAPQALAGLSIVADLDSNATNGPDTLQIEPTDTVLVRLWFTGTDSVISYGVTVGDTTGALSWVEETTATIYNSPSGWTNTSVQQDSLGWLLLQATDFSISTPIQVPYEFARLKFYVTPGDSCGTLEWNPDLSAWFNKDVGESTFVAFEGPTICVDSVLDGGEDGGEQSGGREDSGEGESPAWSGDGLASVASHPIRFIKNEGQLPDAVQYYIRGSGGTVYFLDTEVVVDRFRVLEREFVSDSWSDPSWDAPIPTTLHVQGVVVETHFEGARYASQINTAEELPGKFNFFLGNDPARWCTDVPSYSGITYRELCPGIDVEYYQGSDGYLKYDVVVQPGTEPSAFALDYEGHDSLCIRDDGALLIFTALGDMIEAKPTLYQVEAAQGWK
ncbi:MAG: hypothetical protein ABIJ00_12710 [Candidatus Eisenbacteria bacterium]